MNDEANIQDRPSAAATVHAEREVPITHTSLSRGKLSDWSAKRALVVGTIAGAFFGIVFFAGYAATSVWICSARLECGHWAPITIVSVAGAVAFTVLGAIAGYLQRKIYRSFRVV